MQEDMKAPLILGRSFLSTTNAHIDVGAGEFKFNIMKKKSILLSSQDQNNAPMRSKCQDLHL
jgi:hypothetical protein